MDHEESLAALDRAAAANEASRPVEIDGEVVVRPASPVSATTHAFLTHLRAAGLTCVPQPLGFDDEVERLRLLAGADGGEGWYHQHTDDGVASAAALLRQVHDAGRTWTPPSGAVWGMPEVAAGPGEDLVLCHGDPGPWNFIWRDRQAVGLIDWDYLHPGPRVDDVAYALRWFAPLRSDEMARDWHHFRQPPDRRHRIGVFLDAYGDLPGFDPADVVDVVVRRIRAGSDLVRSKAEQGLEPQRTWVAEGALEETAAEVEWLLAHRHLVEATAPGRA